MSTQGAGQLEQETRLAQLQWYGRVFTAAMVLLAIVGLLAVYAVTTLHPQTDDAEIFANYIGIAPVVQGPILHLNVADNQQVAMAMGINVQRYFGLAWAMAGVVSALGGIVWGAMLGVDNQLALVGLKVFPVVILGGLDSIIGAVVGGLVIGITENLAAGYLDPYVGGGTKDFVPYVLMIAVLMIRPEGMFGRRRIERV